MNYLNARNKPAKVTLDDLSRKLERKIPDEEFCTWLDENDELACFRKEFLIPLAPVAAQKEGKSDDTKECIYFNCNALGLQCKNTIPSVEEALKNWGDNGSSCYFIGNPPVVSCEDAIVESMAKIVGAHGDEIAAMNSLTVNLHLLLVSFYEPTSARHKILIEQKAFPSQYYAVESHIRQRGFDPESSILLMKPREGEETWRTDDILKLIDRKGDEIALVMLSGVHYHTGQLFDMEAITEVAHQKQCLVGFDLAHAVGNVELRLHDWQVDFACWCSYKYLNSGPGGIAGWFGHKISTRFEMNNVMDLSPGIQGYKLSNQSPLLVACCRASLDLFDKTTMATLRGKSVLLTGYLEMLLQHYFSKDESTPYIDIITPSDFRQRGCQLSLKFSCSVSEVHKELKKKGVACTLREPKVIRVAPVPLYNSFCDVYNFVEILRKILK